jgi:hypothetical protein
MGAVQEISAEVLPEGLCVQKAPTSMDIVGGANLELKLSATASEGVVEELPPSLEETLPADVITNILDKVKDVRDLASCMATSKTLNEAAEHVRSLILVCRKQYYDLARKRFPFQRACSVSDDDEEETDSDEYSEEEEDDDEDETCEHEWSSAPKVDATAPVHVSFKHACLGMLRHAKNVQLLRIEVDAEMQANPFQKKEIHMVDFWLSEPMFVRKWLSLCSHSLRHLTIVDYGQQAIMRQSPILRALSESCKNLHHLELRNMYLDTTDLHPLPSLQSLTLRCIKLTEAALTDINTATPALQTLALVSVFGVQEAHLASPQLQILCLGLSTAARSVDLHLPQCTKLQLKMTCPDALRVHAPQLAYVAVCMENRSGSKIEFDAVTNLRELLFGATHFHTLSSLLKINPSLQKLFLDVPCMAMAEDGHWQGVLETSSSLPEILSPALHTLSVGPGLWHVMEQRSCELAKWLPEGLCMLVVHMVAQTLEGCVATLQGLVAGTPSLRRMEVYVHLDSPVHPDLVCCAVRRLGVPVEMGTWKRSLNFACFSF